MNTPPEPLLSLASVSAITSDGKAVLHHIDLVIGKGETCAIIGRNGSGKSSLGYLLVGKPGYQVTEGSARFAGHNLFDLSQEERAAQGLFMAFQNPVAIPGVSNMNFIKTAVEAIRKARGLPPLTPQQFLERIKHEGVACRLDKAFLSRSVNHEFSGGEKKRNELLQLRMLEPALVVLDETDSGLDTEAVQLLVATIKEQQAKQTSFLVITHYLGLLEMIQPSVVHVMSQGAIVASGGLARAREVLSSGYKALEEL